MSAFSRRPPSQAFGVANAALQDPILELHDGSGALLASNDNWKESQQSEMEDSQLAPTDDREAALQIPLGPGLYTAIVRGAGTRAVSPWSKPTTSKPARSP